MPEFFIIIAREIFSPNFRGGDVSPPAPRLLRLSENIQYGWGGHHGVALSAKGLKPIKLEYDLRRLS